MAACNGCGANDDGVSIVCRFCNAPYSDEISRNAIRCARCGATNRGGRPQCVACSASLLAMCVLCGHGTPPPATDCAKCGEAFLGAAERKSQRDAERMLGAVSGAIGNIARSGAFDIFGGGSSGSGTGAGTRHDASSSRGGGGGGRNGAPPMDT